MSESGVYAIFQYDMNYDRYFLTIGCTKNKKERLKSYRTTNAMLDFDFWSPVDKKNLVKAEDKLKKSLSKKYKTWGNSVEQFEISEDINDLGLVEKFLIEETKMMFNFKRKSNVIDYTTNTLYGLMDVRDARVKCDIFAGEIAMITTPAGVTEKPRRYYSQWWWEGKKMVRQHKKKKVFVSQKAWNLIKLVRKNERDIGYDPDDENINTLYDEDTCEL
tara:strand:- start:76 stop:729 length:654 start_codon:yes stop_codon:yes gene_type:complete